jgi:Tol biopolymer transport system component/DNA-binding winged helix-turn-helix (wHTH) protein
VPNPVPSPVPGLVYEFREFRLDCGRFELMRNSHELHVERKPMELLILLASREGQLVTRQEIAERLWSSEVFVDTEHGINTAIRKIRQTLRDDPEQPRFVQTVAGMGYRFIAPIHTLPSQQHSEMNSAAKTFPGIGDATETPMTAFPATAHAALPFAPSRQKGRLVAAFSVALVVLILALAFWFLRPALPPPQAAGSIQLTQDDVAKTFPGATVPMFTEGSRIYIQEVTPNNSWPIMQVSTEGGETALIDVPLMNFYLEGISPNGLELLFSSGPGVADTNTLWRLPLPGLQPHRIGNLTTHYGAAAWSQDGSALYYGSHSDIFAADADGGHPRKLLTTSGEPRWLRVSPDGSLLRFSVTDAQGSKFSLWEVHSDGGGLRRLLTGFNNSADVCCGTWTTDGKYFVFQSMRGEVSTLWAMRETGDRWRKVNPEPVQLTDGEMNAESPLPSKDGKKIFFIGAKPRGEVMRYDLKTHSLAPYLPGFSAQWLSFSRDGKRMAYVSYPQGILWQSKTDGSDRRQLTFPPMEASIPRWSPDGSQIAFTGGPPGKPAQVLLIPAGGGDPEQITSDDATKNDATWSPDGNSLAYQIGPWEIGSKFPLQVISLKTRNVTVVPDSAGLYSPRWSPDGRYLLALPMDDTRLMLYDFKLRNWQQLTQGKLDVDYPSWTPDGKCVYFNSAGEKGSPEYRICLSDRKVQRVADMAQAGSLLNGVAGCWTGLAPDGSILGLRNTGTEEVYALKVNFP